MPTATVHRCKNGTGILGKLELGDLKFFKMLSCGHTYCKIKKKKKEEKSLTGVPRRRQYCATERH